MVSNHTERAPDQPRPGSRNVLPAEKATKGAIEGGNENQAGENAGGMAGHQNDRAGGRKSVLRPEHPNRATNVPVTVSIVGLPQATVKDEKRTVNQRQAKQGNFASLGKFHLPKGQGTSVIISNLGTKGYVVVDGIQFVPAK